MSKFTASTKKFVADHKVAVTFVATSLAWIVVHQIALKEHDNFLIEKGLLDEFYTPEG